MFFSYIFLMKKPYNDTFRVKIIFTYEAINNRLLQIFLGISIRFSKIMTSIHDQLFIDVAGLDGNEILSYSSKVSSSKHFFESFLSYSLAPSEKWNLHQTRKFGWKIFLEFPLKIILLKRKWRCFFFPF